MQKTTTLSQDLIFPITITSYEKFEGLQRSELKYKSQFYQSSNLDHIPTYT